MFGAHVGLCRAHRRLKTFGRRGNVGQNIALSVLFSARKKDKKPVRKIGKAPEEVVQSAYDALSAGVPEENLFEFLKVAGEGAVAGVTDLSTAVNGLTNVVNAYGQDMLSFQNASDIIFNTVKIGKSTYEELSSTLYNVIPIASSIGVKFEDIGAAVALMTSMGTPTAQATTQIRQALVELNSEGTAADITFRELAGTSFKEFIQEGGNLQEALQMMEESARANGKEVNFLLLQAKDYFQAL